MPCGFPSTSLRRLRVLIRPVAAFLLALGLSGCGILFADSGADGDLFEAPTPEELAVEAANLLAEDARTMPCFTKGIDGRQNKRVVVEQILLHPLSVDPLLGERAKVADVVEPALIDTAQRHGYDILDHGYLDTEFANAKRGLGTHASLGADPAALREAVAQQVRSEFGVDALLLAYLRRVPVTVEDGAYRWCNVREPMAPPKTASNETPSTTRELAASAEPEPASPKEPETAEDSAAPDPVQEMLWATCLETELYLIGEGGIEFDPPLFKGAGGLERLHSSLKLRTQAQSPLFEDQARLERAVETALAPMVNAPCRVSARKTQKAGRTRAACQQR